MKKGRKGGEGWRRREGREEKAGEKMKGYKKGQGTYRSKKKRKKEGR